MSMHGFGKRGSGYGSGGGGGQEPLLMENFAEAKLRTSGREHSGIDVDPVMATDPVVGLSEAQALQARAVYGWNEISPENMSVFKQFGRYFLAPTPVVIWIAAIVCLVRADYQTMSALLVLQGVNAAIAFYEERNTAQAITHLRANMQPLCAVRRNGNLSTVPARELVPGDLLEFTVGSMVPADAILIKSSAGAQVQVDESALTGDADVVTILDGGTLKMGTSIVKGEGCAVIFATGARTVYGRASGMMRAAEVAAPLGEFEQVMRVASSILVAIAVAIAVMIVVRLIIMDEPVLDAIAVFSVVLVASMPLAMTLVCTSCMAHGARQLVQRKLVCCRLASVEALAAVSVLCIDKTGMYTKNMLGIRETIRLSDMRSDELLLFAALGSQRTIELQDAIDFAICAAVKDSPRLASFKQLSFSPFSPISKRTEAVLRAPDGTVFRVMKGAVPAVLAACANREALGDRAFAAMQELADRGLRPIAVALSYAPPDAPDATWELHGIVSLFDPPRDDSRAAIDLALSMGVEVKLLTGDHGSVAKETCRAAGVGTVCVNMEALNDPGVAQFAKDEAVLSANGFCECRPAHKFLVVDSLRREGARTGVTGFSVHDCQALKYADLAIAVVGATDAAKAASDVVMNDGGLWLLVKGIKRCRKIFQRMRNYCIYRAASTLHVLVFFFFAVVLVDPQSSAFYNATTMGDRPVPTAFTLPQTAIVILVLLNEFAIISMQTDKMLPDSNPQEWKKLELSVVSAVLGVGAGLSTVLLLILGLKCNENAATLSPSTLCDVFGAHTVNADGSGGYLTYDEVLTVVFLKISLSDILTVLSARTRGVFLFFTVARRPGFVLAVVFVAVALAASTLSLTWPALFLSGTPMAALTERYTFGAVWGYTLLSFVIVDAVKVAVYSLLGTLDTRHKARLSAVKQISLTSRMVDEARRADRMHGRTKEICAVEHVPLAARSLMREGGGGAPAVVVKHPVVGTPPLAGSIVGSSGGGGVVSGATAAAAAASATAGASGSLRWRGAEGGDVAELRLEVAALRKEVAARDDAGKRAT